MLRRLVLCVTLSVIGLPALTQPAAHAAEPVPLVTQIANEPISVSAAEFRRHLFVAADAARLSNPANTADLLAERVLQHMYALDPRTDPGAAADAMQELRQAAESVTGPAFDSRISRTMVLFQQAAGADRGPVAATLQRATTEVVALTAEQISSIAVSTYGENALGTNGDTESRLLASSWSRRGKLPRGMRGTPTTTGGAYVIKGRPTRTGLFTFTLTATDTEGATATRRYKIRVR